jgi:YhcH/YjgK/YiaL family protein
MIFDIADNIGNYFEPGDDIYTAVEFVNNFDPSQPDGTYPIDGDNIFAIVQSVTTENASQRKFEAHRKFIDVQMVLDGTERQDAAFVNDSIEITKKYDDQNDAMFFNEPKTFSTLTMTPGMFVVYTPTDGHRPCCSIDGPKNIRKVCVKIKI